MKNIPDTYKKELVGILSEKKKIVIIGHHNPDGDAIGGSLGLYQILKNAGFEVSVVMPVNAAKFLHWLPNYSDIILYNEEQNTASKLLLNADIIFLIDFNEESRTEQVQDDLIRSDAVKIMIDHHPDPKANVNYTFSFTESSSASEIVYEFIDFVNLKQYVDQDAASCIYTGIMTDTLNFSVNSSRKHTFKIVAELLSFDIDKDKIYENVYNNYSVNRLKLVGYMLFNKMKTIKDIDFSYMILTKEEMNEFNFIEGDHEGIVNMPLSVSEIKASLIAIEKDDFIKISLRSKNEIDVNLFSGAFFNGGGHKNAAGGKIFTNLEDTEDYIIKAANEFLKK